MVQEQHTAHGKCYNTAQCPCRALSVCSSPSYCFYLIEKVNTSGVDAIGKQNHENLNPIKLLIAMGQTKLRHIC